jgi:malonyl-ACP O-methyltransferase BioC
MNVEGKGICQRFSAAAAGYTAAADIQHLAAQGVVDLLGRVPSPARVVDLGCGTGILTRLIAQRFAAAEVCGVDISPAMIERARAETEPAGRISWQVADAASFAGEGGFDLAASSASFHWMGPLARLFGNVTRLLLPGGPLVFSIMLRGTLGELQALRRRLAPEKAPLAALPAADDVLAALRGSGFEVAFQRTDTVKLDYPSAGDMLRRLHDQGVTGGAVSRGRSVLTARQLACLESEYDREHAGPGGVRASFVVMYVVARVG